MALVKSTDENYKELIASKGKLTLIKFTADWCGPCKAINPILETISEKMADKIVIANHDVDSQPNFATANAIRSIPTLFLYKDTNVLREISRFCLSTSTTIPR